MKTFNRFKRYLGTHFTAQVNSDSSIDYLNADGKIVANEKNGTITSLFLYGLFFNYKKGDGLHYAEKFLRDIECGCTGVEDYYSYQRRLKEEANPKPYYSKIPRIIVTLSNRTPCFTKEGNFLADTLCIQKVDYRFKPSKEFAPLGLFRDGSITTFDFNFQISNFSYDPNDLYLSSSNILTPYIVSCKLFKKDLVYNGEQFKLIHKDYEDLLNHTKNWEPDEMPPWAREKLEMYESLKQYSVIKYYEAKLTKPSKDFAPKTVRELLQFIYTDRAGFFTFRWNNPRDLDGVQIIRVAIGIYEYFGEKAADAFVTILQKLIELNDLSATSFIRAVLLLDKYHFDVPMQEIIDASHRIPADRPASEQRENKENFKKIFNSISHYFPSIRCCA